MAIRLIVNVRQYHIDSASDVDSLPTDVEVGSRALNVVTGEEWFLDGSGEWQQVGVSTTSATPITDEDEQRASLARIERLLAVLVQMTALKYELDPAELAGV